MFRNPKRRRSVTASTMEPNTPRVVHGHVEILGRRDQRRNYKIMERIEVTEEQCRIGRWNCDVKISNPRVSRIHATLIMKENGRATIRNETRPGALVLNGRLIRDSGSEHRIQHGDIFELAGGVRLRWMSGNGAERYRTVLSVSTVRANTSSASSSSQEQETMQTQSSSSSSQPEIEIGRLEALLQSGDEGLKEHLLSFVTSGKDGFNAGLTLREASSVTKAWIENIRHSQLKKIFSKGQVKINFGTYQPGYEDEEYGQLQILHDFLETPPPSLVTSLSLVGVELISQIELTPKQKNLWLSFVEFWWAKLECLEVDYIDNLPCLKKSLVNYLLSAPDLERLHVGHLKLLEYPPEIPLSRIALSSLLLPQRLFQVESLSINVLELNDIALIQFFDYLTANKDLNCLELTSVPNSLLRKISKFIAINKSKSGLSIRLKLNEAVEEEIGSLNAIPTRPAVRSYRELVVAVAGSESVIRIRRIGMSLLSYIKDNFNSNVVKKFYECIEWIPEIVVNNNHTLLDFPNLKRVDLIKNRPTLSDIQLPENLERLGVMFGIPKELPGTLSHLTVGDFCSTLGEFLKTLEFLDKSCPNLKSLGLKWRGDGSVEMVCDSCDYTDVKEGRQGRFKNLKTLCFTIGEPVKCNQSKGYALSNFKGVRWGLMKGFGLAQLSLNSLELGFSNFPNTLPVLDQMSLNLMLKGEISKSIANVEIGETFVDTDGVALLREFKAKADSNALRI